ncbi:uncharacterized protein DNG_03375 [Cephalotrichum gorgonifer]|uniref:Uncharacterized protein n=1 Tax=Cephalotrichum gorgonifer TaxID=2041049 RepID=A0AAE8STY4_9PEZI|nr:uncharacterized protein DNG_03375 [Cephalotrichum gorgonifer]
MPEQNRPRAPPAPAPLRRPAPPPPVRRNLFQSQLTRRPTPASSSAETLRLDSCVDVLSDSDEIVVRDKQGEVEVEGAPEGIEEDEGVDEREEMEKDRQRLAEAVRHYRMNPGAAGPDQTDVLLYAVKTSLRAKVATLADDNWMFEAEPQQTRH